MKPAVGQQEFLRVVAFQMYDQSVFLQNSAQDQRIGRRLRTGEKSLRCIVAWMHVDPVRRRIHIKNPANV